jgi:hypothetical protein
MVLVVDNTVRHEDKGYLEGANSKNDNYAPFLDTLTESLNAETAVVLPVVFGTRICMPKFTIDSQRKLQNSDRGSYNTIWLLALRSFIGIYHTFLDYYAINT